MTRGTCRHVNFCKTHFVKAAGLTNGRIRPKLCWPIGTVQGCLLLGGTTARGTWHVPEARAMYFHKVAHSARTVGPIRTGKVSFNTVQWREDSQVDCIHVPRARGTWHVRNYLTKLPLEPKLTARSGRRKRHSIRVYERNMVSSVSVQFV